jgi:hypothetical protein
MRESLTCGSVVGVERKLGPYPAPDAAGASSLTFSEKRRWQVP